MNLLVYAGSLPPENECLSGLAANIYAREFTRGASQLREKDGEPFVESIYSAEGAVGVGAGYAVLSGHDARHGDDGGAANEIVRVDLVGLRGERVCDVQAHTVISSSSSSSAHMGASTRLMPW